MWLFSMLLQAAPAVGTDPVAAHGESYFSLMAKGGVILIPIFLLAGLAIFLIADKWHFLRKLDKSDNRALAYLLRLIYEGDTDKAVKFAGERNNPAFNVIAAGLKDDNAHYLPTEYVYGGRPTGCMHPYGLCFQLADCGRLPDVLFARFFLCGGKGAA